MFYFPSLPKPTASTPTRGTTKPSSTKPAGASLGGSVRSTSNGRTPSTATSERHPMRPLPLAPVLALCATIPGASWTLDGSNAVVAEVNGTTIRVTGRRIASKGAIVGTWVVQSPSTMKRRLRRLVAVANGQPDPGAAGEHRYEVQDLAQLAADAPGYGWILNKNGIPSALVGGLRVAVNRGAVAVYDAATGLRRVRVEVETSERSVKSTIEHALLRAQETT